MTLFTEGHPVLQDIERAMLAIGYGGQLLRRGYEYNDVLSPRDELRRIEIAGFAQTPPTYRNACIGVVVSNGQSGPEHVALHRALGAPLVFEVNDTSVNRWKVTASGPPELKQQIPFDSVQRVFTDHRAEWEPDSILRAKAVGEPGPIQLDFYDDHLLPFLEGRNFEKLDHVLHSVISKSKQTYRRLANRTPPFQELFPLAFRLIAAKVFRDRGYAGGWSSDNAAVALRAIEKHYNVGADALPQSTVHRADVLQKIWEVILSLFHFANLSEDDLALIFEKTFITPATRKKLGIHSTPPRVAQYLVNKLPLETIPEDQRYVFEPFTGHGRFLVAAMRRMRSLLTEPMSDIERHRYFQNRLAGLELDDFSVEVCRLSLLLADAPNANGWRIMPGNFFTDDRLDAELSRARILLCNPPFESFDPSERARYQNPDLLIQKPAELLQRVLLHAPDLLGLVLPRIFEFGNSYRKFHRQLAEQYGAVELVELPKIFNYSDAATILVLASDKRSKNKQVFLTCRTVTLQDRDLFLQIGYEPPAVTGYKDLPPDGERFTLWIPRLSRAWSYLESNPVLQLIGKVHRGVNWKATARRTVLDTPRAGYHRGVPLAEGRLLQYHLRVGKEYLSLKKEHQHDTAYRFPWDKAKVVCNTIRLSRKSWRLGAVADSKGLAFSDRFIGIWPAESISIFALAAVLNSPLANAYVFNNDGGERHNRVATLNSLPIPSVDLLQVGTKLDAMSQHLHRVIRAATPSEAKKLVLEIDAEVLQAYDLPPALERELLDSFTGCERPVSFEFTGYYPEDFDAYIPLHELISSEFEDARANRLLERLTFVNDPVVSEAMAMLHAGAIDEGLPS
jgi:hypothetical protein